VQGLRSKPECTECNHVQCNEFNFFDNHHTIKQGDGSKKRGFTKCEAAISSVERLRDIEIHGSEVYRKVTLGLEEGRSLSRNQSRQ
jgi:hypothetical protein